MFACRDVKEKKRNHLDIAATLSTYKTIVTVTIFYLEYYFLQLWLRPTVYIYMYAHFPSFRRFGSRAIGQERQIEKEEHAIKRPVQTFLSSLLRSLAARSIISCR